MTALRTWLLSVLGTSLLLSLTASLFPKGKYQTISSFITGLILLLVIIRPLMEMDLTTLPEIQDDLSWKVADTAEAWWEELSSVISEKTAAYIQDKASSLGLTCQAQVYCTVREEIPFPDEVWLNIPYDERLSTMIAADLAIKTDHQHWEETS